MGINTPKWHNNKTRSKLMSSESKMRSNSSMDSLSSRKSLSLLEPLRFHLHLKSSWLALELSVRLSPRPSPLSTRRGEPPPEASGRRRSTPLRISEAREPRPAELVSPSTKREDKPSEPPRNPVNSSKELTLSPSDFSIS